MWKLTTEVAAQEHIRFAPTKAAAIREAKRILLEGFVEEDENECRTIVWPPGRVGSIEIVEEREPRRKSGKASSPRPR
jgi:hypothetical protein